MLFLRKSTDITTKNRFLRDDYLAIPIHKRTAEIISEITPKAIINLLFPFIHGASRNFKVSRE